MTFFKNIIQKTQRRCTKLDVTQENEFRLFEQRSDTANTNLILKRYMMPAPRVVTYFPSSGGKTSTLHAPLLP